MKKYNQHYPILMVDQSHELVDVDETAGASVSQSVSEPVVQRAPGVPDMSRDPIGFMFWLSGQHTRLNRETS